MTGEPERASRERMEAAVRAVRREATKAAVIHASVDAVALFLVANLGLEVVGTAVLPAVVPRSVPLPAAVAAAGGPASLDVESVLAGLVGAAGFLAEYALYRRRPAVERFESVNPPVAEALRTARDALRSDREGPMTERLYGTVLERLRDTSSLGLVSVRRLAATLVLVALVSTANVQVAVVDVQLDLGGGEDPTVDGGAPQQAEREYRGLQNPDEVLGEPEDVSAGSEALNATVSTQGGGQNGSAARYSTSGFAGSGDVESQQAGFAEQEQIEDAELIREYNLRIRQDEDQ